jgi:heat shock protein HslJ
MKLRFLFVISLVLLLTPLATVTLAAPSTQVATCEEEYVVQADDWLSKLADRFYGDMFAFTLIVIATNGQADEKYADIEDPDLIEPGWLLCIPPGDGESAASAAQPELVGSTWLWDQTLMNNDETFIPDNPSNYSVQFQPDGTVSIQADCNQVGGTYTVDGSSITIQTGPTTMAACPPGSLGDQFVAQLSQGVIYFFQGENLFLDLKFDSGTMQFTAEAVTEQLEPERVRVWADDVAVEMVDGEYVATLNGHFPDSCSTLGDIETTVEGDTINVTVYAERPPDMVCAGALVPFETTFTLDVGELEPGEYTVVVNEFATTTLTVN